MQKVTLIPRELPYEVNEELKYLRTNIQFAGMDKKVLLFTSVMSHEGKSAVVLNLAKSMAEMGKRVLLVDTDLRKSMMRHQLTNKDGAPKGMTHLLSGMANLDDVLCVTGEPVMYMILAGPVPPNPSELLGNRQFDNLLQWAREQFDYILVDCPPLGTVIDAAVLAPKCDGAVIVVEAGKVPYRAAQSVVLQLKNAKCPVIGVVLNKVNYASGRKYYNHYYHKYGYGYEYKSGAEEKSGKK